MRGTSDERRPRAIAMVAFSAALGTAVGLGIQSRAGTLEAARPLAPPHVAAKVSCASCHVAGAGELRTVTCAPCHVRELHTSTRAGHVRLGTDARLACASCHPAHTGFQGIAFREAGARRFGPAAAKELHLDGPGPEGQAVPIVAVAACTPCHVPSDPRDPFARCLPPPDARGPTWATTPVVCLDEHTRADSEPRPARGVCGAQHGTKHLAAQELAVGLARSSPWQSGPSERGVPWLPLGMAALFALVTAAFVRPEREGQKKAAPQLPLPAKKRKLPTIDASRCLGCHACVEACPFDVLAVESYVAKVVRPEECCGVVLCAQVCPNGSLTIRDEGEVVTRVPLTEHLESERVPGVFVAGDVTGMPLIKNAIAQGDRVARRIAETLPRGSAPAGALDVVIVGAGPAGLASALRLGGEGRSCVVLEQGALASSILSFPRGKIVHDPPLSLPVEGDLWLEETTKEALVAQWQRIVRQRRVDVREGARVTGVVAEEGVFRVAFVTGDREETLVARRVIVATGRRGSPKALDVPIAPEAEGRVHYALVDAAAFARKRVVVVGLGDSAMEAALAIAKQPGARVTVVARADGFVRGKAKNVAEMERAIAEGAVVVRFGAEVNAIGARQVSVGRRGGGGPVDTLPADAVVVLVGGQPSWELLEKIGICAPEQKVVGPENFAEAGAYEPASEAGG